MQFVLLAPRTCNSLPRGLQQRQCVDCAAPANFVRPALPMHCHAACATRSTRALRGARAAGVAASAAAVMPRAPPQRQQPGDLFRVATRPSWLPLPRTLPRGSPARHPGGQGWGTGELGRAAVQVSRVGPTLHLMLALRPAQHQAHGLGAWRHRLGPPFGRAASRQLPPHPHTRRPACLGQARCPAWTRPPANRG